MTTEPASFDTTPPTSGSLLALMVTRRCNMRCAHCSVASTPEVEERPPLARLEQIVADAHAAGVRRILFTGGEPMLRPKDVLKLMQQCHVRGMRSSLATNGSWATSRPRADAILGPMRQAGLDTVNISYDRFHAAFEDAAAIVHAAEASVALGIVTSVTVTRMADDSELSEIMVPIRHLEDVQIRIYDVQKVGNAAAAAPEELRHETEGFCSSCAFPAVTDDGRVTACNGPAYFESDPSPLIVGSLENSSLNDLIWRHTEDPILETIRRFGPAGLRDELRNIPGFESFPFRAHYAGMCDLCHHITRDPSAVAALRERLGSESHTARRVGIRMLMKDSRKSGLLNRAYLNSIGIQRLLLHAMSDEPGSPEDAEKILGRADLDWNRLWEYVVRCDVARNLQLCISRYGFDRWIPRFFVEQIAAEAVLEGMKELCTREAMRVLSRVLGEMGARGVLLKGTSMLALNIRDGVNDHRPVRSSADIDLYVEGRHLEELRRRLLESGFSGCTDQELEASRDHLHLPPLVFRGTFVELHRHILPTVSGIPEREMLAAREPVGLPEYAHLDTLSGEGMLLHCMLHSSKHWYIYGLKVAWDLNWMVRHPSLIDWDRLARWVATCRFPREFWVPFGVLCDEMQIAVPETFLGRRPADRSQRILENFARRRFFVRLKNVGLPIHENPFVRLGIELLLRDRLDYRIAKVATSTSNSLGRAWRRRGPTGLRQLPGQFWRGMKSGLRTWVKQR